ncbi:MAG: DUF86 domain-containing protein [Nanoarchaeota archaeon]
MEKQFIKERIEDKMKEIEKYVEELSQIKPHSLDEYRENFEKKAACERYAEKIPEALTDLAFLAIKYSAYSQPKNDKESFEILSLNKVITPKLAERLQDAKGMRNIIAHEYGKVSDEIVFEAISSELEADASQFLKAIQEAIMKEKKEKNNG